MGIVLMEGGSLLFGANMRKSDYYSVYEASRLTGVREPTLQAWCLKGIVQPSLNLGEGRGMGKRFSLRDLVGLRSVRALRQHGVSMQRIRKLTAALRDMKGKHRTLDALAASRLVVLPSGVVAVMDDQQLLEVMTRQTVMDGIVCLDMAPIVTEIVQAAKDYEAVRRAA
jgi:DNA-binding transcriptional MerR regulator